RRGAPRVAARAGMLADGLRGFEHDFGERPAVPPPDALRGYQELTEDYEQWYPIWRSIEGRPVSFREPPGEPRWHTWMRFTDTEITDRTADALRQTFWLDFPSWNATTSAHPGPFRFLTP